MIRSKLAAVAVLATLAIAAPAAAAQIFATSYDMQNGDGQAHGGSYNYWDRSYTGVGLTNVDGAALTGGLGDLTDGIVAAQPWYVIENAAGTGPYVGWLGNGGGVTNPLITFNFAGGSLINSISIHLDNSQAGGVGTPSQILVDGVSQAFAGPAPGTIGTVTLGGLSLAGASHTIQFIQDPTYYWTFVSEVTFNGTTGVPEPASWALMIGGFGLAGAALRRRRAAIV